MQRARNAKRRSGRTLRSASRGEGLGVAEAGALKAELAVESMRFLALRAHGYRESSGTGSAGPRFRMCHQGATDALTPGAVRYDQRAEVGNGRIGVDGREDVDRGETGHAVNRVGHPGTRNPLARHGGEPSWYGTRRGRVPELAQEVCYGLGVCGGEVAHPRGAQ